VAQSITVPAVQSSPFVHVDERAVVLCDGSRVVVFEQAMVRWVAETLRVMCDEGRATRSQGDRVFGGFLGDEGSANVYAGTRGDTIALRLDRSALDALRAALPG
jgi:hypothetical protein